jgi:short-subunit dehydrogenase
MNLEGRRVLLTGASGGIGIEVLRQLLQQGARVVAASKEIESISRELRELGGLLEQPERLLLIEGDLTDPAFRASLVARVRDWGRGGLDLLINAAGAGDFALLEHQASRGIDFLVALNLTAPMDLARQVLPLLKSAPAALIVNIGSVFGAIGYPGNAVYSATKFGLRGFSEALRRELADTPVRVLYLAPRAVRTPLNSAAVNELNDKLGNAVDDPSQVAGNIVRVITRSGGDATFGWPEKLFVRLNAVLPGIVDGAIGSKLSLIKTYAMRNKGKEYA